MSKRITLDKLSDEIDDLLKTYLHSGFEQRQKGLQAGAEVLVRELEKATPRSNNTGVHMADFWKIKTNYKDRRYVGNTKLAGGVVHRKEKDGSRGEARTGVPLSNVLEYAENSPHQGFIRRCFDENEPKIYEAIKNKLQNGG